QQTGQVLAQGGKDYIRHGIVVTAPRAILVILPPLVAAAPGLDGQTRLPRLDRPAIEVGADVGVSPNAAKAFANDQICPSRAALSVGLVRTRGSRAGSAPKSWASTSLGTLGRVALTACSHHRHRKDPSLAATTFSTSASQVIPSCSPLLACRSCPTPARLPPCELSLASGTSG